MMQNNETEKIGRDYEILYEREQKKSFCLSVRMRVIKNMRFLVSVFHCYLIE
jgi:hypothetical protein